MQSRGTLPGDFAADFWKASHHRRNHGAARSILERTMSLIRPESDIEIEVADRELC